MECTIYVHVLDFFPCQQPLILRSIYHIFFYHSMYCTFPVVIFVRWNIAAYLPEFTCPQRLQCVYYFQRIFDKYDESDMAQWLERRSCMQQSQENPVRCVFNMFSFAGFFWQMDSKVHHLKILEFCSLFTGKMALENFRPFTFCSTTLRSICRNYPVNLKQC